MHSPPLPRVRTSLRVKVGCKRSAVILDELEAQWFGSLHRPSICLIDCIDAISAILTSHHLLDQELRNFLLHIRIQSSYRSRKPYKTRECLLIMLDCLMNSWMNPSTSKICPLENTPKRIVLVQTDLERSMQLTTVTYWNLKFPTGYHFGLDRGHLKLCNWRGGDIVSVSERPNVFRLTFPLTLARRSFRNSARCVRDWIELDVGGLIPWKHDIYP